MPRWYVVVTRDKYRHPVDRFATASAAGDYIFRQGAFTTYEVLCQEGEATAPMRELRPAEHREVERRLYPSLFELD